MDLSRPEADDSELREREPPEADGAGQAATGGWSPGLSSAPGRLQTGAGAAVRRARLSGRRIAEPLSVQCRVVLTCRVVMTCRVVLTCRVVMTCRVVLTCRVSAALAASGQLRGRGRPRRVLPPAVRDRFTCRTCSALCIGYARLEAHYRKNPTHQRHSEYNTPHTSSMSRIPHPPAALEWNTPPASSPGVEYPTRQRHWCRIPRPATVSQNTTKPDPCRETTRVTKPRALCRDL